METCNYTKVDNHPLAESEFDIKKTLKFSWKPLLRQVFVCFGLWIIYFLNGLVAGAPTVIIPQMRKEANSTAIISEEMTSWLMSVISLAAVPFVLLYPALMHFFGRKIVIILVFLQSFIGFIVFYCTNTPTQLLISLVILGVNGAASLTITPIMVSEYTSPRYRGIFLTIKSASSFWGMWISNAIGTFFDWKVIGVLGLVLIAYGITIAIWPESPPWLATKGRFTECAASHRWLKGKDKDSEEELEKLINSQKVYFTNSEGKKAALSWENISYFFKTIFLKENYKPLWICILLFVQYLMSGKMVCALYILEIIKKITGDESTAYKTMLILDGVTVIGMYIGCGLAKYFKRRTLMMTSSIVTATSLFLLSIYLYLIKFCVIVENSYVSIFILTVFSLGFSFGPMILSSSLNVELMPLRYKSVLIGIEAVLAQILFFIVIKQAPSMFLSMGLHGSFLFYAIGFTICSLLLYKYLPETKDKTLQEIEEYFKD